MGNNLSKKNKKNLHNQNKENISKDTKSPNNKIIISKIMNIHQKIIKILMKTKNLQITLKILKIKKMEKKKVMKF